jgi:hypothetical protein
VDPKRSTRHIVDFQARLMPAIDQAATAVRNARRLLDMAAHVNVPAVFTKQNAKGLGPTIAELPRSRSAGTQDAF